MKRTKLQAAFTAGVLIIMMSACQSTSVSNRSGFRPTPTISPAPPQPVEFINAVSKGTVEYILKPMGAFRKVVLHVTNKSESTLRVSVDVGTEFDSTDVELQLVVFKKAQLDAQSRRDSAVELEVASLDIHKLPSSNVGTAWRVHKSARLTQFLQCASDTLEKKKRSNEAYAKLLSGSDSFMFADAVWSARGASRADFMDHLLHRVQSRQSHADVEMAAYYPVTEEITRNCGSLKKLD